MRSTEMIDYNSILNEKLLLDNQEDISPQTISGVVIQFDRQRLRSLILSQDGQLRWEVSPSKLTDWREEGVRVAAAEDLQPIKRGEGRMVFGKENALIGATVTNSRGIPLGKVDNFLFSKSGTILSYVVSRGFLKDLFSGKKEVYSSDVKSITPNMLVLQH